MKSLPTLNLKIDPTRTPNIIQGLRHVVSYVNLVPIKTPVNIQILSENIKNMNYERINSQLKKVFTNVRSSNNPNQKNFSVGFSRKFFHMLWVYITIF